MEQRWDKSHGDIISDDGKNTSNIKARMSKGLGIITIIVNLLVSIIFNCSSVEGKYVLESSKTLKYGMELRRMNWNS